MLIRTSLPALAAVVLLAALHGAEPKSAAKPTPIYKTEQPIKIDGVLDDPAWKRAVPIEANYIWGKVGQRSKEPRMTAKYTWDDHYLYLGYETFDKNLVALGSGEKKGPKDNERERCLISHPTEKVDVVEFFISFGDEHFFWEVHHNAANHFSDIFITVADDSWPASKSSLFRFGINFGFDVLLKDDLDARRTRAMAVKLKPKKDGKPSTINAPGDEDTGYTAELRLPWYGLGAPLARETFVAVEEKGKKKNVHGPWKMAGQEMMILAVFQDGDLADHYHHSSPTKPGGWFHKGADLWPKYVLGSPK
ncbi:MAG TPA: sugar-binding protein [Gemmataceae bacterium]|jgi:hypothetical protein